MIKIVLTGGPCGGKTVVQSAIKKEFGDLAILVPEIATLLINNGFPAPGKEFRWNKEWDLLFSDTILPLQLSFEKACLMTAKKNCRLMICDRGVLDVAAHFYGGTAAFCKWYGLSEKDLLLRYEAVVHLKSMAVIDPCSYGKSNNDARFGSLSYAKRVERMTRIVWAKHPNRIIIGGQEGIEGKISTTINFVRSMMSKAP